MDKRVLWISIAFLFALNKGWAEPLGGFLPGSILPEQVSKAIRSEQPKPQAQALSPITAPEQAKTPLGAEAEKIKFQLNNIIIDDNVIYSDAQLRPLYQNKLHRIITVAELFGIVQDITNFYRNNGYIISRAILPPQHVKEGVVHIKVIEGFIDKIEVSGNPKGSKCQVLAFGNKIKECRPLQLKRMEKYLLLANEIPGTDVRAVLSPSKTQTGAADLTLVTESQRVNGYFSYDNYGTRYIGPQQLTGNLAFNSVLKSGDVAQITYTKTPKGIELTNSDINYNRPLDANGTRWLLGWTRAYTHPLFVLQPLDINGVNDNFYTMFQFPAIRTRSASLNYRAGFNYLDSNVDSFTFELYTDHIRSLDLGATYNFADSWYGVNTLSGDFRQGLPLFGYTKDTDPYTALTSRPGGRAVYTKVAAQFNRLQTIKGPFSLYGLISGQWAFNPLLASEQFTFGGSQLGRGYDVAEFIGDRGLAGTLELRYDLSIGKGFIQNLQFYIFYDAGEIWNILDVAGTVKKLSGTSTGTGVRFFFTKYISGNFMWTQTLTKEVAAEELIGEGRRPRVFFSVVASF